MTKRSTANDRSDAFFLIKAKWSSGLHAEALDRADRRLDQLARQGPVAEYIELTEFVQNSREVASAVKPRASLPIVEKEIRQRVDAAWPDADPGSIANDIRYEFGIPNIRGDRDSDRIYRVVADYVDWKRKRDAQQQLAS